MAALRATAAVLAVSLGAGLAGCGSSHSASSSGPGASARAFLHALGTGDGAAACAQLTSSVAAQETTALKHAGLKSVGSCAEAFDKVSGFLNAAQKSKLEHTTVSSAHVSGTTATVTLKGAKVPVHLRRVGGRWLISGFSQL